jgi:hypothetical protein
MRQEFLDDDKSNRHLEDVLKKVQKKISAEDTWLLVNEEDDEEDYKNLLMRHSPKFEQVTEEDIQKDPKIQPGFIKTYDDKTKRWIFRRPCKQTIEWRSTLMDFIRFEKKED